MREFSFSHCETNMSHVESWTSWKGAERARGNVTNETRSKLHLETLRSVVASRGTRDHGGKRPSLRPACAPARRGVECAAAVGRSEWPQLLRPAAPNERSKW